MIIRRTSIFIKWLKKLKDKKGKFIISSRISRLAEGNPGDNRFLGGINELRIEFGPGYRIYYKDTGKEIIILLCGGDKSTQKADIIKAKEIAETSFEEEENGKNKNS